MVVLLKPDFNCFNSFELSQIDKVIARTSVIGNISTSVESAVTQFVDRARIKSILQLIRGASRVL